jgi:AcrR family transcriptional regulator
MAIQSPSPRRGRPPSITRERIAEAGLRLGLSRLTFVGVAAVLEVSHMALYKHVPNLEALRLLVAEEAFGRWQVPETGGQDLQTYLLTFHASLRDLVKAYPGLASYLFRRSTTTPAMMAKIAAHHSQISATYGLPREKVGWLLSTVAFHCIALADTIYAEENTGGIGGDTMEASFTLSMRALILGALTMEGIAGQG